MTALRAIGLSKHFAGVVALDDVSLDVHPGEVHGLIGPNGSGKTTLLNMLSGYYPSDRGSIRIGDEDLTRAAATRRPHAGIARTFQTPRLLSSLSVLHNAMLGGWNTVGAGFLETAFALGRTRREERTIRERAAELLAGVGLGAHLNRRADVLEHAEQRFLEIARGLVSRPRFIMLDEPAAGLTSVEVDHLGAIISTMRDCGIGVLLVEHHTDFVFRICDRVTTLDLGRMIKHGTAEDVRTDADVIRVYLGA
ncbi:MAG: hypothetical protein NVS3B28_26570 [Candidatus Velthaea sp.]